MKKLFTLIAFLTCFMGAKAQDPVYTIDYSTLSSFPFYVMGFTPEWVDGVMTDQGADGWHQYFIADGIPTDANGNYTVKAMVKASEAVSFNVNMGWGWNDGEQIGASANVGTDWQEVTWKYEAVGGTSCNLVAQPWKGGVTIEWKWLKVYSDGQAVEPVWTDIIKGDTRCFVSKEYPSGDVLPVRIEDGVCVVNSPAKAEGGEAWDSQFWIRLPQTLEAGTKFKVTFDYKASGSTSADTQSHAEPGSYIHWSCVGTVSFTDEWATYEKTVTVPGECEGKNFQSIAFNLTKDDADYIFYFKNIKVEVDEAIVSDQPNYPADIFTVAGTSDLCGSEWNTRVNLMKYNSETGMFVWSAEKVIVSADAKPEFKVVKNCSWDSAWPDNNWVITPDVTQGEGIFTITITFDPATNNISVAADKTADLPTPVYEPVFDDGTYYMMNASTGMLVAANGLDKEGAPLTFTFDVNTGTYAIVGSGLLANLQWKAEGDGYYTFSTARGDKQMFAAVSTSEQFAMIEDSTADAAIWILLKQEYWEGEVLSYNIAGTEDLCGAAWDVTANKMTKNAETGLYEWTAENIIVSNDVKPEFKVAVNNTADEETVAWYPGGDNWVITPDVVNGEGIFTITITFNNATKEIKVAGEKTAELPTPVYEPVFDDGTYYMVNASTGMLVAANGLDKEGAPLTFTFDENTGTYAVVGSSLFADKQWTAEGDGYYTFCTLADGSKKFAAVSTSEQFAMIEDGTADAAIWILLKQEYWEGEVLSYNVAGSENLCGTAWDTSANKMTKNAETGLYEWTAENIIVSNSIKPEFKVTANNLVDEETIAWYPGGDNWVITPDVVNGEGVFTITITFNNVTKEIKVAGEKTDELPVIMPDYYLVGTMTNWQTDENYKMEANAENEGEYMLVAEFEAGAKLKIVEVVNNAIITWYPSNAGDYVVNEAGSYTVYFRPEGNVEGWYEGFFFLAKNITDGIKGVTAGQKAVIFDMQGRRVEQPTKGLYIVNGKKVAF